MSKQDIIEFKKERDLGEVISDTFKFFRMEWKGLLSVLVTTSLIPFLVVFVLGVFSGMETMSNMEENPFTAQFNTSTLLVYLAMIIVYHLIVLSVFSYIKVYINKSGKVNFPEVYSLVKKNILNFTALGLLVAIVVFFGALFCLIPGVYLGIVLSLAGGIYVFEEKGVFTSFGESFPMVNWKWWETFGVIFVTYLLMYVIMVVFSLPNVLYSFIKIGTLMKSQDMEAFGKIFEDPIYLVLAFISNLGQHVIYSFVAIALAFVYFDLNEQKNATGAFEKIDSLGE